LAFHSGREADHSPPSSAEVKEWAELCLQSPNTPSWRGAPLRGAQEQLCLYRQSSLHPHTLTACFLRSPIFNTILSSTSGSPKWSLPFRNLSACYLTRPSHPSLFGFKFWSSFYVIFSILLLLPSLRSKYSPKLPYFHTPSSCVPSLWWDKLRNTCQ
jgi:hypothetical protein